MIARRHYLPGLIGAAIMAQSANQGYFDDTDKRNTVRYNIDQHNTLNQTKRQRKIRKSRRRIASRMRAYNR